MLVAPLVGGLPGDPDMPAGVRDMFRLLGMTEHLHFLSRNPLVVDGYVHTSC